MADIFISYAREDAERVQELGAGLEQFGWTVWTDDRIRTAAEFDDAIERELDSAACVVVVWSRSSVASGWVRAEAAAAEDQGKLVPVRFESDVVPPLRFRQLNVAAIQAAHLTTPTSAALGMLAEISRLTGKPPQGIDPALLAGREGGAVSGAEMVTPGKWRITFRLLGAKGSTDLDLHPNGTVSAKSRWLITRADLAGRWSYDAGQQVLQLEMSGGNSQGMEVTRVEIKEWLDDHAATCRFQHRKGRLERLPG